jgi:hypothetical protein
VSFDRAEDCQEEPDEINSQLAAYFRDEGSATLETTLKGLDAEDAHLARARNGHTEITVPVLHE